jgi:hypothetical protein
MASRRSKRRLFNASARWCAVGLRICVVLAAWQGPIPWFHSHGTLAQASDDLWLIKHLQSCHKAGGTCSQECLGWHFHCGFPGTPTDDAGPSPDGVRHIAPVIVTASCSVSPLSASQLPAATMLCTVDDAADSAFALLPGTSRYHFFDAFAPALALPLRFCCLNC